MMMVVALLGACAGGSRESLRWPDHRKHHDAKLDELEHDVAAQQAAITALEARLAKLETEVPPPAPAPVRPAPQLPAAQ